MDNLLSKIKDRISEKNSPVRTVKGVAEAIGMSEAGFYRMVQRDAPKYATVLALSKALQVEESYFTGETIQKPLSENYKDFSDESPVLVRLLRDIEEMKQMFEEQLRAKDNQIAGLLKTVDVLVGKYEDVNFDQLFQPTGDVGVDLSRYEIGTLLRIIAPSIRATT